MQFLVSLQSGDDLAVRGCEIRDIGLVQGFRLGWFRLAFRLVQRVALGWFRKGVRCDSIDH